MKAIAKIIIIVFVAVFVFGAANAQFKKPGDAIKYRKAVMTLIAQHFTRMWIVVQGKADYEKEAFSADADLVAMLASLPGEAFMVPGTDKGDTTMTAAVFADCCCRTFYEIAEARIPPTNKSPHQTKSN